MTIGAGLDTSMSAKIRAQIEVEQQVKLAETLATHRAQDEINEARRRRKKKARKASERSAARNRR